MSTLESTLARLKIEDRIREANQQRLAHEFHRREQPSTTPTASGSPAPMAQATWRLTSAHAAVRAAEWLGATRAEETWRSRDQARTGLGWSRPTLSGLPADRILPNKGLPRVRHPEEDDP